ncbi:MAG: hypothetical protein CUN55_07675 [Phototrophicales bacterium]|nr:MAG: hypothetical protein CUN55_07675 [Phototrophicales bacterium]
MTASTTSSSQHQESHVNFNHDEWLRRFAILAALIGVGISLYLTYVKLSDTEVICAETSTIDCSSVQNSAYAEIAGIPITILGLLGYGFIGVCLLLQNRIQLLQDFGHALLFSVTLFGFIYSLFLTYVEGFILEKWCLWCVASALTMTSLFIASSARLVYAMQSIDEEA